MHNELGRNTAWALCHFMSNMRTGGYSPFLFHWFLFFIMVCESFNSLIQNLFLVCRSCWREMSNLGRKSVWTKSAVKGHTGLYRLNYFSFFLVRKPSSMGRYSLTVHLRVVSTFLKHQLLTISVFWLYSYTVILMRHDMLFASFPCA